MEDNTGRVTEALEDLQDARDRLDRRYRAIKEDGNQWTVDSIRAEIQWIDECICEIVNRQS